MADGETGNPFVDRMRRLDSEAMVGIEGTHEQSVKHLRKLNAQRVDELVEEPLMFATSRGHAFHDCVHGIVEVECRY